MECDLCFKECNAIRCPYCGKYFCSTHIQPEVHNCEGMVLDQ
ncbi:MAG: hypothetical protein DSO09_00040 [Candidatus Methanomethylicota archaeon]|jgi:predicted nucleic acid binding AN1-type Zn finger protein|uniref:AN1-type domain-containing protein n=1 Tax=Thermoproteota archaeon TaxID=2056631 RepID=A0A520KF35_9CREN|nr:MAG: hypothetical protein EF809_03730 [Candidatus Verstraetearchaeota archaeon]TDA40500.1 MAG: hypothetical protein DSO09_00040 [Candidatus Verstraetearchaeota archaeon]